MYEEAFEFNGRPFTMAPFVKHFFREGPVRQAIDQINDSIARDAGPAIVVGQHGTGKSLLLAVLNEEYQQRFKVISLSCGPMSERRDLLQAILFELKQPYHDLSEGELRLSLIDFIKPPENCPNGVLLLIDDAQALTTDLLDELRLITNFVRDGVPRVRVVLCGTDRLEELLTEPKLEAFNQRLSTRCFLSNLTREQTKDYIHEHVVRVGGDANAMFEQATTDAIHEATCGCPRFINQLAEQCMIYAATHGSLVVEPQMVAPAWAQAQGLPTPTANGPAPSEAESNDENWTVIEFGSLDDEDDAPSEPEQVSEISEEIPEEVSEEISEASTDVSQYEDVFNTESTEELADGVESDQITSEAEDSWSDVGASDPFVQSEPESNSDSEQDGDEPADAEPQTDDTYSYQPIDPELVTDDEPENESQSIPMEFGNLNLEHEDTSFAADLAQESADSDSFSTDALSSVTESSSDETEDASASQMMAAAAIPAIAAAVSVGNPFEEAFESEEPVAKEFSELVAEQNVSSAQITGSQLDHLPTSEQETAGVSEIPIVSLTEEYPATDDAEPVGEFETTEATQQTHESTVQIGSEYDPDDGQASVVDDTPPEADVASEEPENGYTEDEVASVFGSLYSNDAVEDSDLSASETSESDPSETYFDSTEASLSEASQSEGNYHQHNTGQSTPDVQQQADEILNSMQTSEIVDKVDETEPSLPDAGETAEPNEDNVELSDAQRILSEILEHKNLLNDQFSQTENTNELTASEPEFPPSLPMPTSFPNAEAQNENLHNNEPTEASTSEGLQSQAGSRNPDATPLSIGRAERMDYERLFEQLRDSGNES